MQIEYISIYTINRLFQATLNTCNIFLKYQKTQKKKATNKYIVIKPKELLLKQWGGGGEGG